MHTAKDKHEALLSCYTRLKKALNSATHQHLLILISVYIYMYVHIYVSINISDAGDKRYTIEPDQINEASEI